MSLVGTVLKDSESLYFGLAKLYLGDSATYEDSITAVLVEDDYFSCMAEISFVISKNFIERYSSQSGFKILSDIILFSSGLKIDAEFIELTEKNLSYVLGGDGSDANILDNLIAQPGALRAELIFTYPNKIDHMTLILPKVKVTTKGVSFDFQSESPLQLPISLSALKCTHVNWISNPIGKIIFS